MSVNNLETPKKRNKGKGCLFILGIIILLIVVINILGGGKNSEKEQAKEHIATTKEDSSKSLPVEEKKVDENVITSGHYVVGKDLPAGEYKVFADGSNAYIEDSKDSSGSFESILFNDNFNTFTYIIVSDGQYLKLKNCYAIPVDKAKKFNGSEIKDGMYKVGVDIPAGEYNITTDGDGYIEVNTKPYGIDTIVTNSNFNNNEIVTVSNGQYLKILRATAVKK